jgi:transcription termination factor NusB
MKVDRSKSSMTEAQRNVKRSDAEHHLLVEHRQLARRLAVQVLFEVDSVGHRPGDVIDQRLANPEPGENVFDPPAQVSPEAALYLRWLVAGVVSNMATLDIVIRHFAPEWPAAARRTRRRGWSSTKRWNWRRSTAATAAPAL